MTANAATNSKPTHDLLRVYQLADHLDATLAMGEDLLKVSIEITPLVSGDANAAILAWQDALTGFARRVRTLELNMAARLLQARVRATEIDSTHPRFEPFIKLFIGGTAPLADAAARFGEGLGDISELALASGPDVLTFLKSRGIVDADLTSQKALTALAVNEEYVLMECIHLSTLLDMIAKFLDALDLAFDLYAEPRAA